MAEEVMSERERERVRDNIYKSSEVHTYSAINRLMSLPSSNVQTKEIVELYWVQSSIRNILKTYINVSYKNSKAYCILTFDNDHIKSKF